MPFKSPEQRKLFYAMKNNPALAKEKGISMAVVKEMIRKDKESKKGSKS